MRPSVVVSLLVVYSLSLIISSEAKLQQQAAIADENEDDDDDDWDEDEDDENAYGKPEVDDDGRIYKNPRNSPSAMCPRDEEKAGLLGQKCLRKCSTDEDCKSKKKKCRCDGACGMSCIKPERECPELSEIHYGKMTVTGKLFGDRAHYTCDPGYFTVGLTERNCRADGQWTGTTPSCKKEQTSFCSTPLKIQNAKHNASLDQTSFDLDTTVQYFCDHGFQTTGTPTAKCLMMDKTASWWGPDIKCEPRSCGAPTDIPNGWHAGECYTYNCRVAYHCVDAYELVGRTEKVCLADGTWSPKELPQCVQVTSVQCPQPENPRHGKAVYTSTAYNSIVSYECNYGYSLSGQATRRCSADRKWSGQAPTCQEINCGSPGILYNGWVEENEPGEHLQIPQIKFVHFPGQFLSDHSHPLINPSSTHWVILTLNIFTNRLVFEDNDRFGVYFSFCQKISLGPWVRLTQHALEGFTNRKGIERALGSKEKLFYFVKGTGLGVSVIFRCKERMKMEGNTSSVCQADGKWRYPLPNCWAPCVVPQIEKGRITVASHSRDHINNVTVVEHGEKLLVSCIKNYEFAANSTPVVCRNGTWSIVPSCSPARCKQMPKSPRNGMVIAPKTDHGMKAVFKCKDGFTLVGGGPNNSSKQVECRYGNWTGDIPHCIEVYCAFPGYIQNGKVLLVGNMGVYDYRPYVKKVPNNKQIMYDCDKGYVLSEGPPGATCIGGNWSPKELPACLPGQHPRLRWSRRRRSVGDEAASNSTTGYRKFIEFFRRIGKKLLHLEFNKAHVGGKRNSRLSIGSSNSTTNSSDNSADSKAATNSVDGRIDQGELKASAINNSVDSLIRKKANGHKNKSRSKDERMIEFLRIVYRKLRRIDSRRETNGTNTSMHELLNLMSQNFFNVNLAEVKKNNSSHGHQSFEVKNQREFAKLKREFERIMKFYNKSLRWSEKHNRRESKRRKSDGGGHGDKKMRTTKDKKKKRNRTKSYYKGFYEFINGYVNEKLSILETQNGTDELMRKMNIDQFTVRNGTTFTIGEIYAFFKHIIENKLNVVEEAAESVTTTESTIDPKEMTMEAIDNQTTSSPTRATVTLIPTSESGLGNEIPTMQTPDKQHEVKKHRTKRIRNAVEETTLAYQNRKLLSVHSPLSNVRPKSTVAQVYQGNSLEAKSKQFTLNGLDAQQQSRSKRFLAASELDNQIILKNLYLNAYEDEYRANVRRSISQNNRANWTQALRRRKGNLDHYEIK